MTEPEPPQDDWGTPKTPWNQPQQPQQPPPPGQWQQPPPSPAGQWQQPAQPYGAPMYPGSPRPNIRTYLIPAIFATLFCCLPAGIASIVFASQVSSKLNAGDVEGATKASNNARLWLIITVVAGLIAWVIYLIVMLSSSPSTY